ncbi:MAG TPA: hypothetical protein VL494_13775 [Steroidobacteraceae bacterium]|jgi:hypothetical protein|nr:hypothetical protein [Steroidobacteraceae bacterium]
MTLTNPKPLGWAFGEILTSTQINSVASQLTHALDGAGGGSYTLSAPLTIGGDTVTISDTLVAPTISGNTAFANDVDIAGSLSVPLVSSAIQFDDDATFAGTNPVSFSNGMTVSGTPTFNGYAQLNGGADLGNAASDPVALKGTLTPTSGGHIQKTGIVVSTAAASVDINSFQHVKVTHGSSTTTTLTATGVGNNDWFRLYNASGVSQDFNGLVTFTAANGEGALFVRISGTWQRFGS